MTTHRDTLFKQISNYNLNEACIPTIPSLRNQNLQSDANFTKPISTLYKNNRHTIFRSHSHTALHTEHSTHPHTQNKHYPQISNDYAFPRLGQTRKFDARSTAFVPSFPTGTRHRPEHHTELCRAKFICEAKPNSVMLDIALSGKNSYVRYAHTRTHTLATNSRTDIGILNESIDTALGPPIAKTEQPATCTALSPQHTNPHAAAYRTIQEQEFQWYTQQFH